MRLDNKSKMVYCGSIVLFESGNNQIELCYGQLVITDGWLTNYITCYGDGSWGADSYISNKAIIKWLNKNCDRFVKAAAYCERKKNEAS
jgi:hypothetical protein